MIRTMQGEQNESPAYHISLVIALIGIIFYVGNFFLHVLSFITTYLCFHNKSEIDTYDGLPGISIIKPLVGLEPLLQENIESHFTLQYPKFELLFCFTDERDPCIELVNTFIRKYPLVDVRIFIGGKDGIINPKVSNMAPAYDNAKYDYIWITDSRIKISTEYAFDMVTKLQRENVALVHQMPFTTDVNDKTIAGTVEKIHFGSSVARFYPALNSLGVCCCIGMSCVIKKHLLDEVNGLNYYGQYLAEDFFFATALHQKGYKLVMSTFPAQQNYQHSNLCKLKDRLVRWVRLRLNMMTVKTGFLEPLSEVVPLGILGAWTCYHFLGVPLLYFFSLHILWMLLVDYLHLRQLQNGPLSFSVMKYIYCWFIREFLSAWVFVEAFMKPQTVMWGTKMFHVKFGGHATRITDKIND